MPPEALAPFPQPAAAIAPRRWHPLLGTMLVLGCVWGILINQLRLDWTTNPQYSYGWLVPFLALYLFYQRWASRPEPSQPGSLAEVGIAVAALALCFVPTRLVREATPEWSVVNWALALEVVGLTITAVVFMGGWNSARHFAFPICFFLVAVAWPVRFESALTQSLMQRLAAATAELVGWAGVSAVPQGNLIRLSTGVVGVDEACSGVRSLQSMLMASLFLGELQRFPWMKRVALVAAGLALAVIFNVVRALALVTVTIRHGLPALQKWHDPAGFSILLISFAGLCLVARLLRSRAPAEAPTPAVGRWRAVPGVWVAGMAAVILLAELGTEAWYRSHEIPGSREIGWTVRWPESNPGFHERPISAAVRSTLAYNEGREAVWAESDGSRWSLFLFKWRPSRTSTMAARLHRPEVCLPAGGNTLIEERPPAVVHVGGVALPFRFYEFDHGAPLYVFFCLSEAGNRDRELPALEQDYSPSARLARVWMGQRNLGQQSIEVVIDGLSSAGAAEAAFRRQMAGMLVPDRN